MKKLFLKFLTLVCIFSFIFTLTTKLWAMEESEEYLLLTSEEEEPEEEKEKEKEEEQKMWFFKFRVGTVEKTKSAFASKEEIEDVLSKLQKLFREQKKGAFMALIYKAKGIDIPPRIWEKNLGILGKYKLVEPGEGVEPIVLMTIVTAYDKERVFSWQELRDRKLVLTENELVEETAKREKGERTWVFTDKHGKGLELEVSEEEILNVYDEIKKLNFRENRCLSWMVEDKDLPVDFLKECKSLIKKGLLKWKIGERKDLTVKFLERAGSSIEDFFMPASRLVEYLIKALDTGQKKLERKMTLVKFPVLLSFDKAVRDRHIEEVDDNKWKIGGKTFRGISKEEIKKRYNKIKNLDWVYLRCFENVMEGKKLKDYQAPLYKKLIEENLLVWKGRGLNKKLSVPSLVQVLKKVMQEGLQFEKPARKEILMPVSVTLLLEDALATGRIKRKEKRALGLISLEKSKKGF